jgi:hypothetical protein
MRPTSSFWPLLAVATLACGRGDTPKVAVTDTASRDLQLAPVDTTSRLDDSALPDTAAAAPAPAAEPAPVAAKPAPAKAPSSTASKPAEPAPAPKPAPKPAPVRELNAGVKVPTTARDSITSAKNKVGDVVSLKVASDVTGDNGQVVIPAGSTLKARITAIKWSENKSDKGTLKLEPTSVVIDGTPYDVAGSIGTPAMTYKHRGSTAGDIAKPAAGAAAGAVVGGLLGKGTGAVIGGVVGGAVGTQRMVETKDNDIIVAPGTPVTMELTSAFKR